MSLPPPPPPPPPFGDGDFTAPPMWQRGTPIELRPRTLSDFLDAGYNLYRLHWRGLVGLVALLVVPLRFIEYYLTRNYYRHPTLFGGTGRLGHSQIGRVVVILELTSLIGLLVVRPLLVGAFTRAVAGFHLGEEPSGGRVFDYGLARLGPVLLVLVLMTLSVIGGLILLLIPGIIFAIRFMVAPNVVVVEGFRGTRALARSWELTKGSFWRLFGITLLVALLTGVIAFVIELPFSIPALHAGTSAWLLRAIGLSIAGVLVRPFAYIVEVLLYLDLRVRKEGLTLERLSHDLSAG